INIVVMRASISSRGNLEKSVFMATIRSFSTRPPNSSARDATNNPHAPPTTPSAPQSPVTKDPPQTSSSPSHASARPAPPNSTAPTRSPPSAQSAHPAASPHQSSAFLQPPRRRQISASLRPSAPRADDSAPDYA